MAYKTGNNKNNTIYGSDDDDVIQGLGGNDLLRGGDGNDTIYGGAGNDQIFGERGHNQIFGNAGDDQVVLWKGKDVIDGGSGSDLLDFYNATHGIKLDLADEVVSYKVKSAIYSASFTNMEGLYGSRYGDVINGDGKDNKIYSGKGDDIVHGGSGNDIINGFMGDDRLFGDAGNDDFVMAPGKDKIDGGKGFDTLDFYYAKTGVTASLADGSVTFFQQAGKGTTKFSDIEQLLGSQYDDRFTGDDKQNMLRAGGGDDTLSGAGGDDFISSGAGNEVMTGGEGSDTFVFGETPNAKTNFDTVVDFAAGIDNLSFDTEIFSVAGTGKTQSFGDIHYRHMQHYEFQTGVGHVAKTTDVRIIYDESDGIVYYDSNGSKSGGLVQVADIGKDLHVTADELYVYAY